MSLRINDSIPDHAVQTDQATFGLHDWIGDSWAILFHIPKRGLDSKPAFGFNFFFQSSFKP